MFLAFSLPHKHLGNVIRAIHARLHITTCRGGVMHDTERRQRFTIILPLGAEKFIPSNFLNLLENKTFLHYFRNIVFFVSHNALYCVLFSANNKFLKINLTR